MTESTIPLIDFDSESGTLPTGTSWSTTPESEWWKDSSTRIVKALNTSGFLLVKSPHLSWELQQETLATTKGLLIKNADQAAEEKSAKDGKDDDNVLIQHPTDPKVYVMLDSLKDVPTKCQALSDKKSDSDSKRNAETVLTEYWKALELVKRQLLTGIAIGLDLEADYFVKLHSQDQSALRLLHYPTPEASNNDSTTRCKPHSDYGTLTLLLTDGVAGLEALIRNEWTKVPYVQGALVVNIGSLLQDWTNGKLLATLHRVVGPTEKVLPRTSLAFFADPDPNISAALHDVSGIVPTAGMYKSVAEYIQWRSGGKGRQRSGLAFSKEEEERAKRAKTS